MKWRWLARMFRHCITAQPHDTQPDLLHTSEAERRLDKTIAGQVEANKTLDQMSAEVEVLTIKSRRAAGAGFP